MLTIRNAEFADEDGLVACLNALHPTSFNDRLLFAMILALRDARGVSTFLAVDGDVIVGTASFFIETKLLHGGVFAGHIEDVAVHPEHQGKGIGRLLVEHCIMVANDKDCYKIVLNCDPKNIPFYEKFGFKPTPDSFMRLDL